LRRANADGSQTEFEYDSAGRTAKVGERRYRYDGAKLTAEADGDGKITKQYVYVEDRPAAVLVDREIYALHTDWRGAPLALTDENRQVVWRADVGLWHDATIARAKFELNLRGSNQYFDAETGLHYNYHRYFDPDVGRYLTPDPIGQAGGFNLYAFVEGDAANSIDSLGLQGEDLNRTGTAWSDDRVQRATFGEKLREAFSRSFPLMASELRDSAYAALNNLLSWQNIATTAAIFAAYTALQATPLGWIATGAMLGLAYYEFGRQGVIFLEQIVRGFLQVNSARTCADLTAAAQHFANAVGALAAAAVNAADRANVGSRIRRFMNMTAPTGQRVNIDTRAQRVMPPRQADLDPAEVRRTMWRGLTRAQKGFRAEVEIADHLIANGYRPVGSTPHLRANATAQEREAAFNAWNGQTGIDGIFVRRNPVTGRDEYIIVESNANGGLKGHETACRSDMTCTVGGQRQMSRDWFDARIGTSGLSRSQQADLRAALNDGRASRVLAKTNEEGTNYFSISDPPGGVTNDVVVGGQISITPARR
jgi:RHS repeat-associated protein